MAVKTYVPTEVRFEDRSIEGTRLVTLYDPDASGRSGSMTTPNALEADTRGGPLVFVGVRDGKTWRVTLPEIAVRNRSAMGFEYAILQPISETLLAEDGGVERGRVEKGLGDYGATF
ncbi:MAG: hypothetical protein ACE5F9_15485 [Phycisphaerae bacterium]